MTKITIELEFDAAGDPLPGTRAILCKLLGLKSMAGHSKQIESEPSPPANPPAPKKEKHPKQPRKQPHFIPTTIPCPGDCGRTVTYRGVGRKLCCPACGGKGEVVGGETKPEILQLPATLPPSAPPTPLNIYTLPPTPKEPLSPPAPPLVPLPLKKTCKTCGQPLITKFGKWYCPTCAAYRELPEDQGEGTGK